MTIVQRLQRMDAFGGLTKRCFCLGPGIAPKSIQHGKLLGSEVCSFDF